jgi:nitrite reductase/ring-hydroxylating ferredoxin subunit
MCALENQFARLHTTGTNVTFTHALPLMCVDELGERDLVALKVDASEVVLWRDDRGSLNLWDDRCCHRGVRLSIGTHTGSELKCRYHGWKFASGGACTFIPAHPDQTPPLAARSVVHTCVEKYGLLWVLGSGSELPVWPVLNGASVTTLRSVTVHAGLAAVRSELEARFPIEQREDFWMMTCRDVDGKRTPLILALLPESHESTAIHTAVRGAFSGEVWLRLARAHNDELKSVRASLESI